MNLLRDRKYRQSDVESNNIKYATMYLTSQVENSLWNDTARCKMYAWTVNLLPSVLTRRPPQVRLQRHRRSPGCDPYTHAKGKRE